VRFANPAGLALLALALPVIAAHILRPRRDQVVVSSILLWRRLERPVSAAQPWQRLRWSLLLVAQLLAVVLLALAVARPERLTATTLADHTVFIVDASGSMAATDGDPDRLTDAIDRARDLRGDVPDGGLASIVIAGDVPRVVLTASADGGEFDRALRTIDQSEGRPDFADTFALAQSLQTGERDIGFVLLTDGGLAPEDVARLPAGTRVERIGSSDTNRAITRLSAEPRDGGLHVRATVRNTGGPAATQPVRIDVDGTTVDVVEVALAAGQQLDVELDVPAGDLVEAFLDSEDLLAADDHAVAVTARRAELDVLVVGDPVFWQEALTSIPGVTASAIDGLPAADDPDAVDLLRYDLVIFNGTAVPAAVPVPFVAVAPPAGVPPVAGTDATPTGAVTVTGTIERPAVTLVRTDDALLAGLDLADVAVASSQALTTDADVLVAGEAAPLLLRGDRDGQPFIYIAFALRDSNLPVQLAFPLLVDRALGELSGTAVAGEPLVVGDRLPVPAGGAEIVGPDAETRSVAAGEPAPRASRGGFWTITPADGPQRIVAVNPPATESTLTPVTVEAPAAGTDRAPEPGRQASSLLAWLLWPLLAVVAVEAWLAWRAVGVSRRQWRGALALRAVVALLIIAAIVDPTWRRPADRVATVFVLDGSASVGATGVQATAEFLGAAVDRRPDEAVAGVVVFGGDAHVDQVVAQLDDFAGAATVVDTTATDVAAGLRLGAALLPNDARRRVVLVSDGRANTGDATDEIEALQAAGIPVDVVALPSGGGPDAAIAGIDVPRSTHPGELVGVVATIESATATPATVVLRSEGAELGRQAVELVAGANTVRFEQPAPAEPGAVLRYQVTVETPSDTIADNDVGYAAVPVDGPLRVLVVEGSSGEADTLAAALEAGGVGTEVVGVADLPALSELTTYAGIVLADVDARNLTGAQIETLTTAVRDLGRGLVTIGGTQSYGVGGYRQSPLSDLLPVDSEITDPQRRRTVAEVLSIDTSESMGACHCAGEDMRTGGGVNKTDISRAAAERTIAALAETDEIGVLAWNSSATWVIPLQQLPPADVVEAGLGSLRPAGMTDIRDSLGDAAEALLASDAELKHIILFSDGFTDVSLIAATADEAGRLYADHGITTSVLATGEGAAPSLEDIAVQGHGRFYAGTNLQEVPEIMAEEAVIASRNFINEGEFLPEVTSDDEVVAELVATPPLLGYVATTAKSQAATLLRIGPDRDPLLVTWQAGLGRVTSWTSDVNDWSAGWANWDGFIEFWSTVVKDSLPAGDDAGAVQVAVRDGRVEVSVESADAFPDAATAEARVSGPDGQVLEVALERTASGRFEGQAEAARPGTYAVGATVTDGDGETVLSSSTLGTNSYPAEFVPGATDEAFLQRVADATGGTLGVSAVGVWDRSGLPAGVRAMRLLPWLVLVAALTWPLAVLLSRVRLRRMSLAEASASVGAGVGALGRRVSDVMPRFGGDPDSGSAPTDPTAAAARARARRAGAPRYRGRSHIAAEPHAGLPEAPGAAVPESAVMPPPPPPRRPVVVPPPPVATPRRPPPPPPPAATRPAGPPPPPTGPPAPPTAGAPSGRTIDDLLARKRARRTDAPPE